MPDATAANVHFVTAYAKLNLSLEVLGKRDDGYHALASVMQTISLADTLRITLNTRGLLDFTTDAAALATPDNLVLRAAQLLRAVSGNDRLGATLELHKAIPAQAGLGGGSSDAATVLHALNTLWALGLTVEELTPLAAQLGSDVPFFLSAGTALLEGRGEYITPLPDAEPLWLVLAKPPVNIPTAAVFRALTQSQMDVREATDALAAAIRAGTALPLDRLANTLEGGVFERYPEVVQTREELQQCGAPQVRMSGSGPTLFAPFRELRQAADVYRAAAERGMTVWLCSTVDRARALAAGRATASVVSARSG